MSSLRADRVVRRVGDKAVVDGVTLTLRPGETVGLLGPNGSGGGRNHSGHDHRRMSPFRTSGVTVARMVEHDDALHATREAYDAAAATYAQLFRDALRERPLDRAMLSAFAEMVRAGGDGRVADLGCGPGDVTAHLGELGLTVFGIDASPTMIELARQAYPHIWFEVGSMAASDLPDGELDGVLARWSVIHTPPVELPVILAEFHRVLAPGGHLLIGFSATDGPSHPTQVFDHAVAPAHRWSPDHLAALLRESGLAEVARLVREPEPTDRRQFQEVHLLARKDASASV